MFNRSESPQTPIVLLHGWGMNKQVWQGIESLLPGCTRERLCLLDLPGHGDNRHLPTPYTIASLSRWLDGEITQPCILVGWSLGGLLAQHYAHSHPDKVVALGLVASTPKFVQDSDWPGIKPGVLAMFAQQLEQDHRGLVDKFMAIQAMGSETAKQDIKQIKQWVLAKPTPQKEALRSGLEMLLLVDQSAAFRQLRMPTHVLLGKLDTLVPFKVIKELQALNKKIDVTLESKASHAPFISHPESFLNWLDNLMSTIGIKRINPLHSP